MHYVILVHRPILYLYSVQLCIIFSSYGNDICLMDSTYRTTHYALPLYFVCDVPTNVNYTVVAEFVPETEDQESLEEALNIIKGWNVDWSPKFFMCDMCQQEINALETIFPGLYCILFYSYRYVIHVLCLETGNLFYPNTVKCFGFCGIEISHVVLPA